MGWPPIETVGVVAQLGERLNGIQEVVGSIPTSSTKNIKGLTIIRLAPFCLLSQIYPSFTRFGFFVLGEIYSVTTS